ncbi:hypothetical protein EWM64_g4837 [Hericium alpestre]|uniref:SUZ domain-containing protein n=1 Tax=Hericium alpestre TaxID=135208 RepID=A0A4Y9ZYQ6_9AGAM|nr:hypothetical protein EWM64_g4837 [Hericium alpestre]
MAATSFAAAAARPATPLAQPNSFSIFNMNDMASSLMAESAQASSPASAGNDAEDPNADVDPAIIEALKSKDRLFVLRVGELMENLISERKPRIEISPSTSYQKLLVHRCSAFYKVVLENDTISKSIIVYASEESKVPPRRIAELVPAEATKQPAFKIMRRSATERFRSKPTSRIGSFGGEDAELSDGEPSEGGSNGSRGNTVGNGKKRLTMEEREAAYQEARSRIFLGFEDKQKENDMSASSSTFSLVSGSNSTSGGGSSSAGDLDDSISTAATESEWSGPAHRDKRDGRRNGSGANSARSSSRSLRSMHASSSRNSRAASPSFTYASIHDPPQSLGYDASQPGQGFPGYPMQPYGYPYPPPGQAQPQSYMQHYYYPPYSYPPPQHSDPGSPTHEGLFVPPHAQHPQQMSYMPHYAWPAAPGIPQGASHSAGPSPAPGAAYSQYASAPPFAPYPMGYYPGPQPLNPHARGGQRVAQHDADVRCLDSICRTTEWEKEGALSS